MGLNIKNDRVHELAREAARLTGKTQTGAIEEALERLLCDHGQDPSEARITKRVDLVRGLVAEYAADPGNAGRGIDRVEDLYDDATGMPR